MYSIKNLFDMPFVYCSHLCCNGLLYYANTHWVKQKHIGLIRDNLLFYRAILNIKGCHLAKKTLRPLEIILGNAYCFGYINYDGASCRWRTVFIFIPVKPDKIISFLEKLNF